jgi:transketolase
LREPPYQTVLKPYGAALVELARRRPEVVCLGADLTRQTETDLFRDEIPERFINIGMAEANMLSIAGGLARAGRIVFVNTFGVFCTRRCFDQIAMSVAYPNLNVKIVGFMPGLSSPGGPSHQAIEDVALMRALPNMTVVEPADAIETEQIVGAIADRPGPVYLRLKRGEIPLIFDDNHRLDLTKAQVVAGGEDSEVCIVTAGMMLPASLAAARTLTANGVAAVVVNVPVIKPLDGVTVAAMARRSRIVITAENHTIVGGLGSAVAEILAEAGIAAPLRRLGIADTFAEAGSREYLFAKYGLSTQSIIETAWRGLAINRPIPAAPVIAAIPGAYAPV